MEATARYAACIAITNVPRRKDWDIIRRLVRLLTSFLDSKTKSKINYACKKQEIYTIPELLTALTIDKEEYQHLMNCLYKNELGRNGQGDSMYKEIHETKEYWKMGKLEAERLESLHSCKGKKTTRKWQGKRQKRFTPCIKIQ